MNQTFKYFAYGSNLSTKRIHINNPSAVRVGIGKLQNYRLDFDYYSKRWKGSAATIAPHPNGTVWGAIWEINESHLESLNRQEGVHQGVYKPLDLEVVEPEGTLVKCRTYILSSFPDYSPVLPSSRYPSETYKNVILEGAIESQLPQDYINNLRLIPHNGYNGPPDHTT